MIIITIRLDPLCYRLGTTRFIDSIDIIAGVVVNLVIHLVLYSSIDAVAAAATVIIHTADGVAVVEGGGGYCKTDGGNA